VQRLICGLFLVAALSGSAAGTPVIYCTDLFHPHDDPDDHFDLATLFALAELEVKAIVLDQGDQQLKRPGAIPLRQMLCMTGRQAPFAIGLGRKLVSPTDDGRTQPVEFQAGVELLLKTLRESREPVTIITAGSVRDLCAAWNREPALLKEKAGRLYLNIGNADPGQSEYNVELDPQAYIGLLRSGLPIWLCPCLPMQGAGANAPGSTWWRFRQSEVLASAPAELQRYFIYALQRCGAEELDPLQALATDLRPWRRLVWEMDRNMWCTASLLHAAGRTVRKVNGAWTTSRQLAAQAQAEPLFTFVPARIEVDEAGRTKTVPHAANANVQLFQVVSPENYGPAMRDCLRELFRQFPLPLLTHTDVFISGKDGYHTYRIPAVEAAPDGSLIAFAEARKYSADDPGFGKQDIDLVYKRSLDNGATWSPMTVLEDPGELWSAANPATVVDRTNGSLWVFYIRSRPGRSTETARPGTDDMQTLARRSDDNGGTWSEPIDLTATARDLNDPAWRASVPGPGGAIQDRNGRLIVPFWKMPFANFVIYSDDHGRSWQRGQFVPGQQGGDECQVVELADGRILMDVRQEHGSNRWLAESADGGKTWGDARPGLAVTPVACALERFTLQGAGDDRNRLLWTGPKGPERRRLVIRTSCDEGKTFPHERLVSEDYAAYSDLTVLKDKTVGLLWERGVDHGYQFITFTRLNREWLEWSPAAPAPPSARSPHQVISRGESAGTYQAFPDVCRLQSGDLLCVFYAGYGHVSLPRPDCPKGGRICYVRSPDEGRTWTTPRVLFDGPFDDRDPHIAQMRDGTLWCSFFTYRPQADRTVLCDTCLVASRDGGQTWAAEPQVVAPGWPSSAPVRELPDGARILGVYREEGATAYGGVIRSTDGGRTWSAPIPIGKGSGVRLDAETDFVLLKDRTLYAALRGDRVNMHFATSLDGGLTWSPVKDLGFAGHCPHFTRLSTGEILLAHRLPLTALHFSRDEAKTWQGPCQIDDTPGAYPSTVELKDGTVLAVYYEEGTGSAVRARRFRLQGDTLEFLELEK